MREARGQQHACRQRATQPAGDAPALVRGERGFDRLSAAPAAGPRPNCRAPSSSRPGRPTRRRVIGRHQDPAGSAPGREQDPMPAWGARAPSPPGRAAAGRPPGSGGTRPGARERAAAPRAWARRRPPRPRRRMRLGRRGGRLGQRLPAIAPGLSTLVFRSTKAVCTASKSPATSGGGRSEVNSRATQLDPWPLPIEPLARARRRCAARLASPSTSTVSMAFRQRLRQGRRDRVPTSPAGASMRSAQATGRRSGTSAGRRAGRRCGPRSARTRAVMSSACPGWRPAARRACMRSSGPA